MALAGNALEWNETEFDLVNDDGSSIRSGRGGGWRAGDATILSATFRGNPPPTIEHLAAGVRIASRSDVFAALPGDYDKSGDVDAADYVVWREGLGTTYSQADYDVWRAHFGATAGSGAIGYPLSASVNPLPAVPEPTSAMLCGIALTLICLRAIQLRPRRATNLRRVSLRRYA
jgi:hypothetical protein